jgi:tetratricopeptide (TPR) repeat protein
MGLFKNREAKAAIDKYLSNPKKANDADGWYMKGRIYNALSRDTGVTVVESYDLKIEAFKAFQENQKLDKKDIRMALEDYVSYFDLYGEMFNIGIINYNAKNFQGAFQGFKMANDIKDFIISKKYKNDNMQLVAFDTSLIMNIAICAMSAKNEDEAIVYYTKLTDANISGKEHQEIYQYLIEYYKKNNNEKAFNEILNKAKSLYPGDEIWVDIELKAIEELSKNITFSKLNIYTKIKGY